MAEWSVTIGSVSPRFAILRSSAARFLEGLIVAWSEVEQWDPPSSPAAWFSHVAQPHSHDIGSNSQNIGLTTPKDVGDAIVAYLRHGRPRSTSRRLFLRAKAPIRGFLTQCAVGTIVRHALERAGIAAPTTGAHQFRHALATQMLRQGASLTQIGELLGHRSPETTKIYTKIDLDALRTIAAPWPGGVR
jgi:hypothetical protein